MQTAMATGGLLPLLIILLPLFSVLVYATDYNIDCGGSSTSFYTDANSIVWFGDTNLNLNGVTRTVGSANSNSVVMDTMRVFTTGKKNCYDVTGRSGDKVLVRASFYYGNYDGRSSPPSFLLTLDGNAWVTVDTSSTAVVSFEAVWIVKGDTVSVCLCQTNPGQLPFISALQVRDLDSAIYGKVSDSFTLFNAVRVSYGTNTTVRYSDDIYDRIWNPARIGTGLVVASNSDPTLINVDLDDKPPAAVLGNAVTTTSVAQRIQVVTIPAAISPVYINFYFSEVTQLDSTSTDRRWFRIFKNNESLSDPISPPYGSALEITVANLNLTSDTTFSIVPTANSTLPPLINAMEIFQVAAGLNAQTNNDDVNGLIELGQSFTQLQGWGGDPCLPSPYSWEWISCTSDQTPRVTELKLSGFGLVGELPDFSTMKALQVIDLSNNSLSGGIPDFLGNFPNLKQLNLGKNQFSGPIPASISKNNGIKLDVTGNPNVCATGSSCDTFDTTPVGTTPTTFVATPKKKNNTGAIVGAIVPIFVVFWAVVGGLVIRHKRKAAAMAAAGTVGGAGAGAGAGVPVGQKPNGNVNPKPSGNGNVNPTPEGSPAYLLGRQFGNAVFNDETRDQHNADQTLQAEDTQQDNNHNNYNNV